MDILALIKNKIDDKVVNDLSAFLGENPENISSALSVATPMVFGNIIAFSSTQDGTQNIMDILKDGGHNGEILESLSDLLGNFDKTQLLMTIGSNIFNHFAGNNANLIIEKFSSLSSIRKTSAASLLGFASPVVLGVIGKIVNSEGLTTSSLGQLLALHRDAVFAAIPPGIATLINAQTQTQSKKKNTKDTKETKKVETNKKTSVWTWLPWVLIAILFLGGVFYFWKYHYPKTQTIVANTPVVSKPDSASATLPIDTSSIQIDSTQNNTNIPSNTTNTSTGDFNNTTAGKPSENTFDGGVSATADPISIGKWLSVSTDFKKNSAEISSEGNIQELVNYLNEHTKARIQIAGAAQSSSKRLAEDRAYGFRERLLEKGVRENQVSVKSSLINEINAKVTVKITNE